MRRRDTRREGDEGSMRPAAGRSEDGAGTDGQLDRARAVQRSAGNQAVAAHAREGSDAARTGDGGSTTDRGVRPSVRQPILRSPSGSGSDGANATASDPGDPADRRADGTADAEVDRVEPAPLVEHGPDGSAVDRAIQRTAVAGTGAAGVGSTSAVAAGSTSAAGNTSAEGKSDDADGGESGGATGEYAEEIERAREAIENGNREKARSIVLTVMGEIARSELERATSDLQGDFEADGDALEGSKPAPLFYWMAEKRMAVEDVVADPDPKHYALGAGLGAGAAAVLAATRAELPEWILEEGVDLLEGEVEGDWGSVSASVTEATIEGPALNPTGGSVAGEASVEAGGFASDVRGEYASGQGGSVSGEASYESGGFSSSADGEYASGEGGSASGQASYGTGAFESMLAGEYESGEGGSASGEASYESGGFASQLAGEYASGEGGSASGQASYESGGFASSADGEYASGEGGSASGTASYESGGFASNVAGGFESGEGGSASGEASYETGAFQSLVAGSWDPSAGAAGSTTLQYDDGGFSSTLAADYAGPEDVTSNLSLNYQNEGLSVTLQGEHSYDGSNHSIEVVDGTVEGPLASGLSGSLQFETGAFDLDGPSGSLPTSVQADVSLDAGGEDWSATLDGSFESGPSGTRVEAVEGSAGADITPNLRGDLRAWYERTPDPVVGVGGSLKLVDLPDSDGNLEFEYGQAPGGGNRRIDVGLSVDHRITEGVNLGAGGSYGGDGSLKGEVELTVDPSKLGN